MSFLALGRVKKMLTSTSAGLRPTAATPLRGAVAAHPALQTREAWVAATLIIAATAARAPVD